MAKVFLLASVLSICFSCEAPNQEADAALKEKSFIRKLDLAMNDFSVKRKTDTLDFNDINTFAWDSLYVFNGSYTRSSLDKGWGWINWDPVLQDGFLIPEHVMRFMFIKGSRAVKYMDVSTVLVRNVHYFKYFKDTRGYLHPYKDEIIAPHFMPVNCFARKESKFILVRPLDIFKGDSTEFVYAKSDYFLSKKLLPKQLVDNRSFDMHPVSGCGLPNCLANDISGKKHLY